jgi:hypothetical protein
LIVGETSDFQVFLAGENPVRALVGSVRSPVQIRAPRCKKAPPLGPAFLGSNDMAETVPLDIGGGIARADIEPPAPGHPLDPELTLAFVLARRT